MKKRRKRGLAAIAALCGFYFFCIRTYAAAAARMTTPTIIQSMSLPAVVPVDVPVGVTDAVTEGCAVTVACPGAGVSIGVPETVGTAVGVPDATAVAAGVGVTDAVVV